MKTPVPTFMTLFFIATGFAFQERAPHPPPPANVSRTAVIADEQEPGTRLVITGKVYHSDQRTPYEGLVLYFYQTDNTGVYNKTDGSYMRPRLYGWVKTDRYGSYEIRTIKPGAYPGRREAAHIHVTVNTPAVRHRWLDSYLFEGDPNLSESERRQPDMLGRLSPVLRITKDKNGVLHAVRDLVMLER